MMSATTRISAQCLALWRRNHGLEVGQCAGRRDDLVRVVPKMISGLSWWNCSARCSISGSWHAAPARDEPVEVRDVLLELSKEAPVRACAEYDAVADELAVIHPRTGRDGVIDPTAYMSTTSWSDGKRALCAGMDSSLIRKALDVHHDGEEAVFVCLRHNVAREVVDLLMAERRSKDADAREDVDTWAVRLVFRLHVPLPARRQEQLNELRRVFAALRQGADKCRQKVTDRRLRITTVTIPASALTKTGVVGMIVCNASSSNTKPSLNAVTTLLRTPRRSPSLRRGRG